MLLTWAYSIVCYSGNVGNQHRYAVCCLSKKSTIRRTHVKSLLWHKNQLEIMVSFSSIKAGIFHQPKTIEPSQWEAVQKTFGKTKCKKPKHVEKHMLAGFLKCSDCGANLNYKYTHANPDNHYFSCRNKRENSGLCAQTHHIRVDTIMSLIKRILSDILRFAELFED